MIYQNVSHHSCSNMFTVSTLCCGVWSIAYIVLFDFLISLPFRGSYRGTPWIWMSKFWLRSLVWRSVIVALVGAFQDCMCLLSQIAAAKAPGQDFETLNTILDIETTALLDPRTTTSGWMIRLRCKLLDRLWIAFCSVKVRICNNVMVWDLLSRMNIQGLSQP